MKSLRDVARGQSCQFRGPGCLWTSETVVLCHIRKGHHSIGSKPADEIGFWGCERCHALYDGRRKEAGFPPSVLNLIAFDALIRTLQELNKLGYHMREMK
jgi:hypothetical protein